MQFLENLFLAYCDACGWIMRTMIRVGIRGLPFQIVTLVLFVRPCAVKMMKIRARRGEVVWPPSSVKKSAL